jgi:transposase
MSLTLEERIEIMFLCGREGWSQRRVAEEFNTRHPEKNPETQSTVSKLVSKFKETGSVADKRRSGRPPVAEEIREGVVAKVHASPRKSIRRTSMELGVPKGTVHDILKQENFHPYKLQIVQHLTEDDPDDRLEICQWFLSQIEKNEHFLRGVLFSDEANFYANGEVNKQNHKHWSTDKPHWFSTTKTQGAERIMVCCGVWDVHVIGPLFFHERVTGENYLNMLGDQMIPQLDELGGKPDWFMQDGPPPPSLCTASAWLAGCHIS